jgi:putative transcriptional regulator
MTLSIREGRILVASPSLMDPNFFRTVVLICRHDAEHGSFGLVLNRRTDVSLGKVLADEASERPEPIWVGGPVDAQCLWVVHRLGEIRSPGDEVMPGVYFGGDPPLLRRLMASQATDPDGHLFRFYAGYAGWGKGQLLQEIEEGAWHVVPAGSAVIFGEAGFLWNELLVRAMLPWDEGRARMFHQATQN